VVVEGGCWSRAAPLVESIGGEGEWLNGELVIGSLARLWARNAWWPAFWGAVLAGFWMSEGAGLSHPERGGPPEGGTPNLV